MARGYRHGGGAGGGGSSKVIDLLALPVGKWVQTKGTLTYVPNEYLQLSTTSGDTFIDCLQDFVPKVGSKLLVGHNEGGAYTEKVRIYDFTTGQYTLVYSGNFNTTDYWVDLSAYAGKKILVSIGINHAAPNISLTFAWQKYIKVEL